MSRNRYNFPLLFSFVVAVAVLSLWFLSRGPREPKYHGRFLRDWVQGLPYQPSRLQAPPADIATALHNMGPDAVSYLAQMLRARDSRLGQRVIDTVNELLQQQDIKFRYRHACDDRIDGLKGVAALGAEAATAIPEVSKILELGLETRLALQTLDCIGNAAVPALIQALTNANPDIRDSAALYLTHFRERADIIVPALINGLDDPDAAFRAARASCLGSFGAQAQPAANKLWNLAWGKDFGASQAAISTLIVMDPQGTLDIFLQRLESADVKIRASAAERLRWFAQRGSPAVPALIKCLKDDDRDVRMGATIALGEIGQSPDIVVPALIEELQGNDVWQQKFAALSLGNFGDRAKSAVPVILKLIEAQRTNDSYQTELKQALQRIDPDGTVQHENALKTSGGSTK